jgi:hypothetical protein
VLVSQIRRKNGVIQVVAREGTEAFFVKGVNSLYEMAKDCARSGQSLVDRIGAQGFGEAVDLPRAYAENRILSPITHPDAAHLHLTGTGLTHLGSAATRDTMHSKKNATQQMTDSMKMFQMGVEGGKPNPGKIGVSRPDLPGMANWDTIWQCRQRVVRRLCAPAEGHHFPSVYRRTG